MLKNYFEVRDWLEGFIPLVYGKEKLGLVRIENLLEKLGNPQRKFKSVHVGGTSGKGSTAYYIARLLVASKQRPETWGNKPGHWKLETKKLKIGLHVSPHLVDVRERMQIFQSQISNLLPSRQAGKNQKYGNLMPMDRFIGLANEIKPVVDAIIANQPQLTPSYFEILVAMSFLYFAQEKVDWAVVEVGLGGRLDATNVLSPEISLITNVGLDHTEILGNTIGEIAWEKAGIIKAKVSNVQYQISNNRSNKIGTSVVTAASGKALKVIEKVAKRENAPLIKIYTQNGKLGPNIEPYLSHKGLYDLFSHNLYSAKSECMILANMVLFELGVDIDKVVVKRVLENQFPGRFEEIDNGVILDGAHNSDKIRALLDFVLKSKIKNQKLKVILVIAFKKGKDWKNMIDLLVKELPIGTVIVTEYQSVTDTGKGSSIDADEIKEYLISNSQFPISNVKAIRNSQEAVFEAISNKEPDETVLVTGSLYLVGEARTLWELPEF